MVPNKMNIFHNLVNVLREERDPTHSTSLKHCYQYINFLKSITYENGQVTESTRRKGLLQLISLL